MVSASGEVKGDDAAAGVSAMSSAARRGAADEVEGRFRGGGLYAGPENPFVGDREGFWEEDARTAEADVLEDNTVRFTDEPVGFTDEPVFDGVEVGSTAVPWVEVCQEPAGR